MLVRAQERSSEELKAKQRQYVDKALKIELKKKRREAQLRETMERKRLNYIEKKQRQDQEYQKQREKERKTQSEYAADLEQKDQKVRDAISV